MELLLSLPPAVVMIAAMIVGAVHDELIIH